MILPSLFLFWCLCHCLRLLKQCFPLSTARAPKGLCKSLMPKCLFFSVWMTHLLFLYNKHCQISSGVPHVALDLQEGFRQAGTPNNIWIDLQLIDTKNQGTSKGAQKATVLKPSIWFSFSRSECDPANQRQRQIGESHRSGLVVTKARSYS